MVERLIGQLSLADGLVSSTGSMLDELDAAVAWAPLRALLGKRGEAGPGNSSYPAEVLLRCLLLGVCLVLLTTTLCVYAAGRIFRVGILMQGKGANIGQVMKWVFRG